MPHAPKVSVIIPVYNAEEFLVETLECVLMQDLADIEVVCVDNGSTDRSALIVRELARTDGRLRLVDHPQGGPGAARNRGIDEARGEFVTFLDADDWYEEPGYLSALYEGVVSSGLRAAAGCMVNWWGPDDQERAFIDTLFFSGYEFAYEGVVDWRDWQFDFGFTRYLFDRSLFEGGRHRFNGLAFYEDPPFLVKLMYEVGPFFATNRAHYVYRLNRTARRWTTGQALDLMRGVQEVLDFSRDRGLAKLHSLTVHHFDYFCDGMGVTGNGQLDLPALSERLQMVERAVDNDLLERAGDGEWLPFEFMLRKDLDVQASVDFPRRAYRWLRYQKEHRR